MRYGSAKRSWPMIATYYMAQKIMAAMPEKESVQHGNHIPNF